MKNIKRLTYKITFLFFLFIANTKGQEIQSNAWKALFSDYSITSSRTLRLETHVRTKRFMTENDQYLIRPSLIYKLNSFSNFNIGVTRVSTNISDGRLIENNIWQQFNYIFPVKKIKHFGWIRLEQRWQKKNGSANKFGSRIRFRSGFDIPISNSLKPNPTSLIIFNEVFLIVEKNFPYTYNQNWTFIGFQKKISKKLVLFSGFQRNSIKKTDFFVHKNIWSSILFYKI